MGLLSWVRGFFGGTEAPAAPPPPAAPLDPYEASLQATYAARDRFWAMAGTVENDVIGHLISPGLTGGPHWPTTRQAYRVVRNGDAVLLATDGLSDPAPDQPDRNGLEIELFVQCADLPAEFAGGPGNIDPLKHSWMMALLSHVAGNVADAGGINAVLDRYGVLSMELPGVSQAPAIQSQLPAHYVTGDDALGILIGGPAPAFPTDMALPLSPTRAVPLVLLTAAELGEIRAGDDSTREAVAAALAKMDYTSLHRESLA